MFLFYSACNNKNHKKTDLENAQHTVNKDFGQVNRKYKVKSGTVTYETRLKTISVNLVYKSVVILMISASGNVVIFMTAAN